MIIAATFRLFTPTTFVAGGEFSVVGSPFLGEDCDTRGDVKFHFSAAEAIFDDDYDGLAVVLGAFEDSGGVGDVAGGYLEKVGSFVEGCHIF